MTPADRKRIEWEALDAAFRACVALRDMDLSNAVYGFIIAAIRTADLDVNGKALAQLQDGLREIRERTERP